jgi:hypothetical protein
MPGQPVERIQAMRLILNAFLGGLLLLCYPHYGSAQGTASPKAPARKFKHTSKVESIYDKGKDQTTVYLRPMTLRYVKSSIEARIINEGRTDFLPAEVLSLTTYFKSPGKVFVKPQFVVIGFRSFALDKTPYTNDRGLTVTLDGSAENLDSMEIVEHRIDERMSAGSMRYVVESLELPIPYESFLRITKARKAAMRLGGTELQLQNEHLEAFRDLISRVE